MLALSPHISIVPFRNCIVHLQVSSLCTSQPLTQPSSRPEALAFTASRYFLALSLLRTQNLPTANKRSMHLQAIFPHAWFTDEGPEADQAQKPNSSSASGADDQRNEQTNTSPTQKAHPTNNHATDATAPDSNTTTTPSPRRRNSFDHVCDLARANSNPSLVASAVPLPAAAKVRNARVSDAQQQQRPADERRKRLVENYFFGATARREERDVEMGVLVPAERGGEGGERKPWPRTRIG